MLRRMPRPTVARFVDGHGARLRRNPDPEWVILLRADEVRTDGSRRGDLDDLEVVDCEYLAVGTGGDSGMRIDEPTSLASAQRRFPLHAEVAATRPEDLEGESGGTRRVAARRKSGAGQVVCAARNDR
jgi:hypothetical protein